MSKERSRLALRLAGLQLRRPAGFHPRGPRKRSAAGRSGTVPAVVPDGGIHALSGLRS
ncbi:hypothetical protein IE979_14710 [Klebsiella pneumoniae]|uniref:Uncharacterized protein n=1 Tax=Klebsiella pneumoniae TaxID=573 RepID=A0A927DQ64_KLEPN|nr:hypothetical protein [Klebsiella pneumoniae]MBD3716089.1 hypothetical protein [Klebsiella pneumoniae]